MGYEFETRLGTRDRWQEARMKVIHLLRKPLSEGTVAANVLRHGSGALHVDATRIGFQSYTDKVGAKPQGRATTKGGALAGGTQSALGRWPANLILQHLDGCVQDGVKMVKGDGHFPSSRPAGSRVSGPSGHVGQKDLDDVHLSQESVPAWTCTQGCPVASLDASTGMVGAAAPVRGHEPSQPVADDAGIYKARGRVPGVFHGDQGGASRFFKQVRGG